MRCQARKCSYIKKRCYVSTVEFRISALDKVTTPTGIKSYN